MTKKLNIAYVGFGKSTNRYHIPYVKKRENIVIKRVVNRTLGKRPEQAELEATRTLFSTDVADIINDDLIDLVVIVTPAFAHYDYAKQLLLAGKNVLCDKPLVETLEQAKELVDIAKEKNLFFMPFQNRRFDSDFLRTAPTALHCPRRAEKPRHPHPRRSDFGPRHRERKARAGSPQQTARRAHLHRHRPSAFDHSQRRPHRCHRPRACRRTRHPCRTDGQRRHLRETYRNAVVRVNSQCTIQNSQLFKEGHALLFFVPTFAMLAKRLSSEKNANLSPAPTRNCELCIVNSEFLFLSLHFRAKQQHAI